jgi:hypothetical protein
MVAEIAKLLQASGNLLDLVSALRLLSAWLHRIRWQRLRRLRHLGRADAAEGACAEPDQSIDIWQSYKATCNLLEGLWWIRGRGESMAAIEDPKLPNPKARRSALIHGA